VALGVRTQRTDISIQIVQKTNGAGQNKRLEEKRGVRGRKIFIKDDLKTSERRSKAAALLEREKNFV